MVLLKVKLNARSEVPKNKLLFAFYFTAFGGYVFRTCKGMIILWATVVARMLDEREPQGDDGMFLCACKYVFLAILYHGPTSESTLRSSPASSLRYATSVLTFDSEFHC